MPWAQENSVEWTRIPEINRIDRGPGSKQSILCEAVFLLVLQAYSISPRDQISWDRGQLCFPENVTMKVIGGALSVSDFEVESLIFQRE